MGLKAAEAPRKWEEGALTRKGLESANILNMLDVSLQGLETWTHAIYSLGCYTYSLIALRPKLDMPTH